MVPNKQKKKKEKERRRRRSSRRRRSTERIKSTGEQTAEEDTEKSKDKTGRGE